ncbi:MAG: peptidoglycan-N-acetylglucosamine deacetylase [Acidimicrobiaceae bacterium]
MPLSLPPALRSVAIGHGLALLGLAILADGPERAWVAVATTVAAVALAAIAARGVIRQVPRPRLAPLGLLLFAVAAVLVAVTPRGVLTVFVALVGGAGAGLLLPRLSGVLRPLVVAGAGAAAVEVAAAGAIGGRIAALRAAVVIAIAVAAMAVVDGRAVGADGDGRTTTTRAGTALVTAMAVLAGGLTLWVGGNDPTVKWFGDVVTHGDRAGTKVAITFDDGPDAAWSMEVAQILDQHGAKGTFFEVGKAIRARPDIAKALKDDGHLLANHSYHHDYWGWLNPSYPELDETQDVFRQDVGVCPAFFRPPHGQRTPFMLTRVRDRGMHTVTWDVSARDWTETDGQVVARDVLDNVHPGSIILLHDGLDGRVNADRAVMRTALPLILDGLKAKGLTPVRLDELLGLPGYLPTC